MKTWHPLLLLAWYLACGFFGAAIARWWTLRPLRAAQKEKKKLEAERDRLKAVHTKHVKEDSFYLVVRDMLEIPRDRAPNEVPGYGRGIAEELWKIQYEKEMLIKWGNRWNVRIPWRRDEKGEVMEDKDREERIEPDDADTASGLPLGRKNGPGKKA